MRGIFTRHSRIAIFVFFADGSAEFGGAARKYELDRWSIFVVVQREYATRLESCDPQPELSPTHSGYFVGELKHADDFNRHSLALGRRCLLSHGELTNGKGKCDTADGNSEF